jgi:FSR family fosmidomycin resistance protein-like MFS transporter
VVVRSAVQIGITTFLPFLVQAQFPAGQRDAMKAVGVSAFLLASAVSGPVGGHLSDRFGRKTVMVWSFLLAPWPMLLAFTSPGVGMVALLAAGAFILMLPHPGNVVLAQELLPDRPGIAASMITGLAWGVALLLALPLGAAAERIGVMLALQALCLVPLLGVPLVAAIPGRR